MKNKIYKGEYEKYINKFSKKYGVNSNLIAAIIKYESNFNPKAKSIIGAKGLMQLKHGYLLFNPYFNIKQGTKLVAKNLKLFNGDLKLTVGALNCGSNCILKYKGIPDYAETKNYVKQVMKYYNEFNK